MKTLHKRLFAALLPVTLLGGVLAFQPAAMAKTDRLIIESGNTALNSEQARQDKEQWDGTRMLRNKVNNRVEKEFDKTDRAFDNRDACNQSYNVNAYWESSTLRCLDRRTGRPVAP